MKKKSIEEFVADWMAGHESETFVSNENGVYIYHAGHSYLNLVSFFENLLEDYIDYKTQEQIYKNYPNLNATREEMDAMRKLK